MSRVAVVVGCLALTVVASAQGARGSLSGTVSVAWSGERPRDAPIQIRHRDTGAVLRTASDPDGRYQFADVPAGEYELTVAMPCCGFDPYRRTVAVRAGQTTTFDISLVENVGGKTLGDDPGRNADLLRDRAKVPNLPVPRTPDGKPDLSGVWLVYRDRYPEDAAALPWAAALAKQRIANNRHDAPHTRCLPGDFPVPGASSPWLTKFLQTPTLLAILFEDVPGFRQVFLDGRSHPADPNPAWLGHSVGRWEGDTLVIDTVGFNDQSWIGVYPHTEQLRTTERYRRPEYGRLEVQVVYDDPGTFTRPWTHNLVWYLAPQEELIEFVCENNRTDLLVGK
ncbi:MAG: carboxypeptidase regulatory-like domain-containing protein [Acidobacteria bacterium]|nr:carboxypeptidase regulatory-like domain-containing protein [Acidobacteriota bacterium]